jgi:succinate-semialdehyde dehydrogenase / glutarate-semialdehyde dehydrogenase
MRADGGWMRADGGWMRADALIGGRWLPAHSGRTFEVRSPVDSSVVGAVTDCDAVDTRRAIEAAAAALGGWSRVPVDERGRILLAACDVMLERDEELAALMAREAGKPVTEARGEVAYAAGFLAYFANEARRPMEEDVAPPVSGKRVRAVRQPVGVAGLITVWNFPAAAITRPLGAALAAGCTAVVKPAEQSPHCAAAVMDILQKAGFPPGVINLVPTSRPEPVARELVESPVVRKLSFTGSAAVGKALMRACAGQVKRITLELGGHAPFIVFADADLGAAVEGAVRSKFRNSGQTCIAANRMYVEEPVAQRFTELLVQRVARLKLGDPRQDDVRVGPLIDACAVSRLESQVEDAIARGARVLIGGRRPEGIGLSDGLYFEPTVLAGATDDMAVMREESFGPLAPIATFSSEHEVVSRANGLPSGLAAFVYTGDRARAERISTRLEFGIVGINDPLPGAPQASFGGVKESGLGKEGGSLGLDEFVETKLVSEGLAGD